MSQNTLVTLSLLALILPLLGFLLLIFFGRKRLPRQGDVVETGLVLGSLVLSFIVFSIKF
jgi:NADH:ubiquinone oxidoreductase subunit 5 (subunit L)/multisubunit Na+/H+ antiporter MnhA subunit